MDDIYIYQYDGNRVFTTAFKVEDIYGPVPAGTTVAPPELKKGEFAQWNGQEWSKLSSYPVPVLPELQPDPAQVTAAFEHAVQSKLDAAARERGYDSLATAISYAEEPAVPRFQADGQAFRRWRSLVWDYAHSVLNAVLAGDQVQPELDEFLESLPALELPAG
ncbi:hypothetical protein NRB16_04160 [Pseudomonas sp. LJDD11]|uniref:hypothetical protein n=1 Tax=Pseudomonas sp. LJDD11 TaxID=2931984 RepID=UPI00211B99AB|nr:hypothetical protein [Pseudomonas sp. LJDD11]MCQ9422726.1 hypothetical protein [Pseudomonas sp. LJDD11]